MRPTPSWLALCSWRLTRMTTTALVVMEPGAAWPGQIGDSMDLVAFSLGAQDLVQRTERKLEALQRNKRNVRVAVLACDSSAGSTELDRRAHIARLLLGAMNSTVRGRLILSVGGRSSPQLRQELFTLAEQLTDDLRRTSVTVSLQFTEPHCAPGRRRSEHAPEESNCAEKRADQDREC
jgi:hypothetical protein